MGALKFSFLTHGRKVRRQKRETDRCVHTHTHKETLEPTNQPPGARRLSMKPNRPPGQSRERNPGLFQHRAQNLLAWAAIIDIAEFATKEDDKKQTITT